MTQPKYRPLAFGITEVTQRFGEGGVSYLRATQPLAQHAQRMTDRLHHWASTTPDRTFIARRVRLADGTRGDWHNVTYQQALDTARCIGQSLVDRGLSVDRPVAILSENDLEHALLSLGCMMAGVPYCPVSPAYSTISQDYQKLRHVLDTITPGLVFAADAARYGNALMATVGPDVEIVLTEGQLPQRAATPFASLLATQPNASLQAAFEATGPDTIVKFLFTSGSTKNPKGVINTQRMWCANQQQIRQSMPAIGAEPPVLVDWLPWNHTFGGNHNFGLTLYNGGTLYIDDGKPVPALMGETLRNLREIAPTVYFNVPTGFEAIANALRTDEALRRNLLSRVKMFFYAGAALAQPIWDALHASQEQEIGERIVMTTGLGMTESGPFALFVTNPNVKAGDLGVPTAGMEIKLIPVGDKIEVRYKGPNITPGYWRAPEETAEHFDEEGFFKTGDAVKWIDDNDIHQGLRFDGRIAEDFKLATGTFVSVGPLRAKIIATCAPYVQDAVITGINLREVGALLIPTQAVLKLAGLTAGSSMAEALQSAPVREFFQARLQQLADESTGSATRVARALVMAEPPSIDKGEVTDKGSINQKAVLKHRQSLVDTMHDGSAPGLYLQK